jgi:hypothetical protein
MTRAEGNSSLGFARISALPPSAVSPGAGEPRYAGFGDLNDGRVGFEQPTWHFSGPGHLFITVSRFRGSIPARRAARRPPREVSARSWDGRANPLGDHAVQLHECSRRLPSLRLSYPRPSRRARAGCPVVGLPVPASGNHVVHWAPRAQRNATNSTAYWLDLRVARPLVLG